NADSHMNCRGCSGAALLIHVREKKSRSRMAPASPTQPARTSTSTTMLARARNAGSVALGLRCGCSTPSSVKNLRDFTPRGTRGSTVRGFVMIGEHGNKLTPTEYGAQIQSWAHGTALGGLGTKFISAGEGRARAELVFKPE